MSNKKTKLVERRLYEYALHAACSKLSVDEAEIQNGKLAQHVAKLFNVVHEEHEEKYMRNLQANPRSIMLYVDVKKARNLPGEDGNGLSDPYCKISVIHKSSNMNNVNGMIPSTIAPPSPSETTQKASLFSCIGSTAPRDPLTNPKTSLRERLSRSSSRRRPTDNPSIISTDNGKALRSVTQRTAVQEKTVNPEWNQQFEFEIQDANKQFLRISVFDFDRGQTPGMKAVVQEKRGVSQKIRGIRTFCATGQIEDDFLGQVEFDIKTLTTYDHEQWFPLTKSNQNHSNNNNKPSGEILLGLKLHFKLDNQINWITNYLHPIPRPISKDDKTSTDHQSSSNTLILEFRRLHSSSSADQIAPSIISYSSIFRKYLRPASLQVRDNAKNSIFENNEQAYLNNKNSCLTLVTDSDLPLFIEEYHQLYRIIMLHQLEDTRETHENKTNELGIIWNGLLNDLSYIILVKFRILYNISPLSESFIQLLVIMELRCSDEYSSFISQAVIEAVSKLFMDKVRQRNNVHDLDFTDYEKTVFNQIFRSFIDHYKYRASNDVWWFLPSRENLPNIESIFKTIYTLSQLKICSNETLTKTHLQEIIKARLSNDIDTSFNLNSFVFNDDHGLQLNVAREFLDYVRKLTESMSILNEYRETFAIFNVNYIHICFFENDSAADRLAESIICLLNSMEDYFQTYSKPMVKLTSSMYDPNLIQSSRLLLSLYIYLQAIVTTIRDSLDAGEWKTNAFRLRFIEYRQWFSPIMKYLLEGFVANIRQAMERAVEDDNDFIPKEDPTHISESAYAATKTCTKLCQEWESIDYPDINVRYRAMMKLTNTICEQCQNYARRTAQKLSENRYFTDLGRTRSFNVSRKLCTLVNDIEFVKTNVLSSLPRLLNFDSVIETMNENYKSEDFKRSGVTLKRLINTAENEMNDVIQLIFKHVAELVHESLQSKIRNYYQDEKDKKPDCILDVNRYIDQEILLQLHSGIEPVLYSRVACAIRLKVLKTLEDLLPKQESPEFYERVIKSITELASYFDKVCREDPSVPGPPCEKIVAFRKTLQVYALTTEQLQLLYFRELCQIPVHHDHPENKGEIDFRAAHEIVNGLITIHAFIICCRNLPKMDMFGLSDPYVLLELLPYSIYHKSRISYKTDIKNRTLDPEYNQSFSWHRLPLNVLQESGAVLRLSVWDKDYLSADFIGECFVPLKKLVTMQNVPSLRDIPVSKLRLNKPHKNNQPQAFELLRNRVGFDKEALDFVKQRMKVMGTEKEADDNRSTGSYASTAFRSLLNTLSINIGMGFNSSDHGHSDVAHNDKLI